MPGMTGCHLCGVGPEDDCTDDCPSRTGEPMTDYFPPKVLTGSTHRAHNTDMTTAPKIVSDRIYDAPVPFLVTLDDSDGTFERRVLARSAWQALYKAEAACPDATVTKVRRLR